MESARFFGESPKKVSNNNAIASATFVIVIHSATDESVSANTHEKFVSLMDELGISQSEVEICRDAVFV